MFKMQIIFKYKSFVKNLFISSFVASNFRRFTFASVCEQSFLKATFLIPTKY